MLRVVLFTVLIILLVRVAARLWRGLADGLSDVSNGGVSKPSVQMVRDPICGTFVLPDRSVTLSVGGEQLHFCSTGCREAYRTRRS